VSVEDTEEGIGRSERNKSHMTSTFLVGSGQLLIAEGIEVRSIDQVIEYLQLHHEKIEQWKSTPPTSLELVIATTNINATINFLKYTQRQEYASLKSQLDSANDQIKIMTATNSSMGDKIPGVYHKEEIRDRHPASTASGGLDVT
jgi:hypothetical protein